MNSTQRYIGELEAKCSFADSELETLRAKLKAANESVTMLERQRNEARIEHAKAFEDAADWRRLYTEQAGELAQIRAERDEYRDIIESTWLQIFDENVSMDVEHLSTHVMGLVDMLSDAVTERDEARRWVGVWKRSAKMWRLSSLEQSKDNHEALKDALDLDGYSLGVDYRYAREISYE